MINPVGHSHRNEQTGDTRSAQARASAQKAHENHAANVQDTVTLHSTSDTDHDGEK